MVNNLVWQGTSAQAGCRKLSKATLPCKCKSNGSTRPKEGPRQSGIPPELVPTCRCSFDVLGVCWGFRLDEVRRGVCPNTCMCSDFYPLEIAATRWFILCKAVNNFSRLATCFNIELVTPPSTPKLQATSLVERSLPDNDLLAQKCIETFLYCAFDPPLSVGYLLTCIRSRFIS